MYPTSKKVIVLKYARGGIPEKLIVHSLVEKLDEDNLAHFHLFLIG